jgi:hypothetical protein
MGTKESHAKRFSPLCSAFFCLNRSPLSDRLETRPQKQEQLQRQLGRVKCVFYSLLRKKESSRIEIQNSCPQNSSTEREKKLVHAALEDFPLTPA